MLVQLVDIEKINEDSDHIKIHNNMKNLQYALNLKIGQDFKDTKYHTTYWMFNFLQALSDEIVEAKDCINWKWWSKEGKINGPYTSFIDIDNLKIEIIDAMHFLLCLEFLTDFQFTGCQYVNITKTGFKVSDVLNQSNTPVWDCFVFLDYILQRIDGAKIFARYDTIDFYEFKTGEEITKINKQVLNKFLCDSWDILYTIAAKYLGLSIKDIYDIYLLKNKANLKRQDNNYSVKNKTEEDNNLIKQKIHKD